MKRHVLGWIVVLTMFGASVAVAAPPISAELQAWMDRTDARLDALEAAADTTTTTTTVPESTTTVPATTTTAPATTTTTVAETTTTAAPTTTTTSTPTTTTTTAATTTTSPDADVTVRPGDNLNAALAGAGQGATVVFAPGVYPRAVLKPLHQQTLVGHGAVFDGQNATPTLVDPTTTGDDVTWVGFEVTGYTNYAFDWAAPGWGRGWQYDQLYIHNNVSGIRIKAPRSLFGGHVEITNSLFKDNLYHAISQGGGAAEGSLIAHNEFDNNDQTRRSGFARGQILLTGGGAINWTVRDNWVHDGDASGIHLDGRQDNVTIENNLVERHGRAGISFELSKTTEPIRQSVIRGNTVRDSGLSGDVSGGDGAGIIVFGARNVVVENNTVSGGMCGIVARQTVRSDPTTGILWHLENVLVRNNTVHMEPGCWSGLTDTTSEQLSLNANNRFEGNTYSGSVTMRWGTQNMSLAEWQQIHPNDG